MRTSIIALLTIILHVYALSKSANYCTKPKQLMLRMTYQMILPRNGGAIAARSRRKRLPCGNDHNDFEQIAQLEQNFKRYVSRFEVHLEGSELGAAESSMIFWCNASENQNNRSSNRTYKNDVSPTFFTKAVCHEAVSCAEVKNFWTTDWEWILSHFKDFPPWVIVATLLGCIIALIWIATGLMVILQLCSREKGPKRTLSYDAELFPQLKMTEKVKFCAICSFGMIINIAAVFICTFFVSLMSQQMKN